MKKFALSLLSALFLNGCAVMDPGHFIPITGPLSTNNPAPVYSATFNSVAAYGHMSATLADGEVYAGDLQSLSANDPVARALSKEWDSVYGIGFFNATVLGSREAYKAVLTSNKGSKITLQVLITSSNGPAFKGVAVDDKGNLFKVVF